MIPILIPRCLSIMKPHSSFRRLLMGAATIAGAACLHADEKTEPAPILLQKQGSFAVGGSVVTAPGKFDPIQQGAYNPTGLDSTGQTLHGDHAYVFYQVPAGARKLPLVMWHGYGQSARTWETTPDGREGFQTLFLRRKYPVYLLDQPRRGRAARSTKPAELTAAPDEQLWFGIFRLGVWPDLYPGVQFAQDKESLNQFFRQMVPDTGPIDMEMNASAASALFDRIGPGILVTHSHSGGMGWRTAIKNRDIKAIVSFEPGSAFLFPEGEVPEPERHVGGTTAGVAVPLADFKALTRIPILIYFGDNIPAGPSANPGQDQWRANLAMARHWRDAVNRHGGDVTVIHLPEIGMRGNTHFPMSDLNNVGIADHMNEFLTTKGLTE
jgi:pimeloyl-ACP methyl ester carboxylesterase